MNSSKRRSEKSEAPGFLRKLTDTELSAERGRRLFGLEEDQKRLSSFIRLCLDPKLQQYSERFEIYPTALLSGPPNCGKSSLSKKVYIDALDRGVLPKNSDGYILDFSSLLDPELGQSSRNIEELFHFFHQQKTPSFLIIDELDSICMAREKTSEHDGVRRAMTTLMLCLDRFRSSRRLIIIGLTNVLKLVDAAVVRRFFFRIEIKPALSLCDFGEYFRFLCDVKASDSELQDAFKIFSERGFCAGDLRSVTAKAFVHALMDEKSMSVDYLTRSLREEHTTNDHSKENSGAYGRG